jgi:hypothetical protein
MKNQAKIIKTKISLCLLILGGVFNFTPAHSQVSVNINIGSQCLWGPIGYDYVEYYYLPEIDVFYYVPTGEYIYWRGDQEVFVTYLPASYHVDLYTTYKVIINEPKPYLQHNTYIVKYAQYKHGGPKQVAIRDSRDEKYYVVKGHPKYNGSNGNNNNKTQNQTRNTGNNNNKTQQNANKSTNRTNEQKSQPKRTEQSQPKRTEQSQPKRTEQSQPKRTEQTQQKNQQQQPQPSNKNSGSKGRGH